MYKLQPFTRYHFRIAAAGIIAFVATRYLFGPVLNLSGITKEMVNVMIYMTTFVLGLLMLGMAREEKSALIKIKNALPMQRW